MFWEKNSSGANDSLRSKVQTMRELVFSIAFTAYNNVWKYNQEVTQCFKM